MADGLVARLHTDVEALLAVTVIRLGQDVVDVVEHVALVQELVVRLLELQAPAPGDGGEGGAVMFPPRALQNRYDAPCCVDRHSTLKALLWFYVDATQ